MCDGFPKYDNQFPEVSFLANVRQLSGVTIRHRLSAGLWENGARWACDLLGDQRGNGHRPKSAQDGTLSAVTM